MEKKREHFKRKTHTVEARVYGHSVIQSCPTLCDSMGCSSSVHGILQARTLEWVTISFSRTSSQPRD